MSRYWARSMAGWNKFGKAAPNKGHKALVELEKYGKKVSVITQNVDGLHQDAGSKDVSPGLW